MLPPANDDITLADLNLSCEFAYGRRRGCSGIDSSSGNDSVEDRGHENLAVGNNGNGVFVGTVDSDAIFMTEAVGDVLDKEQELGFGDFVGGVGGVDVENCVVC
jgi:hypothetical protein